MSLKPGPDPARARGDRARRPRRLPQGQPSAQAPRRARRHLRATTTSPTCSPSAASPHCAPWRLALVTILQFREDLSDRRAADAVRARIDWKYLLGLELTDPGFDASVLCEFRSRLLAAAPRSACWRSCSGGARQLRPAQGPRPAAHRRHPRAGLDPRDQPPGAAGRDPARGPQRAGRRRPRTGSAVWPRRTWYERYARRIEDSRLPRSTAEREAYARSRRRGRVHPARPAGPTPGRPRAWAAAEGRGAPPGLGAPLRRATAPRRGGGGGVRLRPEEELPPAAERIEVALRPGGPLRSKAASAGPATSCPDRDLRRGPPNLITHVMTTAAAVHEANCTAAIQQALVGLGLPPGEHLVDSGYVDAELLVRSREEHGIPLVGPGRPDPGWQTRTEGASRSRTSRSTGTRRRARCPLPVPVDLEPLKAGPGLPGRVRPPGRPARCRAPRGCAPAAVKHRQMTPRLAAGLRPRARRGSRRCTWPRCTVAAVSHPRGSAGWHVSAG